jgi:hypothetical protein
MAVSVLRLSPWLLLFLGKGLLPGLRSLTSVNVAHSLGNPLSNAAGTSTSASPVSPRIRVGQRRAPSYPPSTEATVLWTDSGRWKSRVVGCRNSTQRTIGKEVACWIDANPASPVRDDDPQSHLIVVDRDCLYVV